MDVLRLLVFCWVTLVALWALRTLLRGHRHAVLVVLVGHWAFNATPLLWDLMFGMPSYARYPNFARAALDPTTNLIHLLFVASIPVLLAVFGLPWRRRFADNDLNNPLMMPATEPGAPLVVLYGLLILPLLLVLLSPAPALYLHYGFIADPTLVLDSEVVFFHSFVAMSAILAVTVATAVLTSREQLIRQWLTSLPWVLLAIHVMGKRIIIALYFVLLSQRLWDLGLLKGARIPLFIGGIIALFTLVSMSYQLVVRNITTATLPPDIYYENLRVDYGRDHTMRAAIFAELRGDKIMSYPAQSLVFDLTAFIPRSAWPEKPYPYGVYMSSYGKAIAPRYTGWTFTTSVFDEYIANYSWYGIVLGPLFLGLLCRLADGNRTILLRSLGYIVCTLFLAVHMNAFRILFLAWLIGSIWHQYRHHLTITPRRFRQGVG